MVGQSDGLHCDQKTEFRNADALSERRFESAIRTANESSTPFWKRAAVPSAGRVFGFDLRPTPVIIGCT